MIHHYIVEMILAHPVIFYVIMGAINFPFCAWQEGRERYAEDKGAWSAAGFIVWPIFLIGYLIWLCHLVWKLFFRLGRRK